MDDLKPLAVFAETVAAGSMSAAARRLGMSPSAVSQAIRALERRGGVRGGVLPRPHALREREERVRWEVVAVREVGHSRIAGAAYHRAG